MKEGAGEPGYTPPGTSGLEWRPRFAGVGFCWRKSNNGGFSAVHVSERSDFLAALVGASASSVRVQIVLVPGSHLAPPTHTHTRTARVPVHVSLGPGRDHSSLKSSRSPGSELRPILPPSVPAFRLPAAARIKNGVLETAMGN